MSVSQKYYIYALVDPRTNTPFYIGKGCKERWKTHLTETKETTTNWHKFCTIQEIISDGYDVVVDFLIKDIDDESIAYNLEKYYIEKYGRSRDGGILTNVCIDNRPPNHKGKTYKEIYGENAQYQLEKRYRMQMDAGGWFKGRKHSQQSKEKISRKTQFDKNPRYNGISEKDLLILGEEFVKLFNKKISYSKWNYFCKLKNINPCIRISYRFNREDLFDVLIKKYSATIVNDSLLWFNNPLTKKQFRCFDWEITLGKEIPEGFVRGRGKVNMKQDVGEDTFNGIVL